MPTRPYKEETAKDSITINTSFSGRHKELIEQVSRDYQCSRTAAVRFILDWVAGGLLIKLDATLKERVERVINLPLVQKKYGFKDAKNFVEWAVQQKLHDLIEENGTLREPRIQAVLDDVELNVARVLLERIKNHYGGLTAEQVLAYIIDDIESGRITPIKDLTLERIRHVLEFFVINEWALKRVDAEGKAHYFPAEW